MNRERRLAALLFVLLALSCGGNENDDPRETIKIGSVAQAVDSDADGMEDGWETGFFGNLSQTSAGDFDSDGMTNGEEFTYGFNPTLADGLDDVDNDRYPNVFEVRRGSDPNSAVSTPTANYTVDVAGGGSHTTLGAAVTAATIASGGAYQIITVAPGVYSGTSNKISLPTSKPKFLIIGTQGAASTFIDGAGITPGFEYGWDVNNTTVIASLTFRNWARALYVEASSQEVRLVDLVVRNNANTSYAAGVYVYNAAKTFVIGSTFLNNVGYSTAQQIYFGGGAATLKNTVLWSQATGTMLAKAGSVTLTTTNCLVKGQTLTGTGNLAGSTDPKLRSDGHIPYDSPLRAAGGTVTQSRVDMDGESRPSSTPDIGSDQFIDTDADDLADQWELAYAGNLTTMTSRTQDVDGDGLSNDGEYTSLTNPTVADTDGDTVSDGDEVLTYSTNPLSTDTDADEMPDGWELAHGLSATTPDTLSDFDQDGYPNMYEFVRGSDPADRASIPTPNYTVNGAGGGTHTNLNAAITAATVASGGTYQIIGVAPGVYSGTTNKATLSNTKPKFLIIGLQGAAKTTFDGVGNSSGWDVNYTAVISGLTFRNWQRPIYVDTTGSQDVRFVDLVFRDNASASYAAGVHVYNVAKTTIVGSTFLNNLGYSTAQQIYIGAGAATITNTAVSSQGTGTMLAKAGSATLTTNNCFVKGQTLTGTGNLAGSTDPKVRSDGRLLWDSPLRAAGGTVAQSRIDMDGELRPSSSPDVGADQFIDTDADQLADQWELAYAGNLTTMTSRTQDVDGDGLSNEGEYANATNPTTTDTDGDTVSDGDEVLVHGTNPLSTDTDADDAPDAWEISYGLDPLVNDGFSDGDGDGFPNIYEYVRSTDPTDRMSIPTPHFTVNGAGGGTHTNINAAISAASIASGGAYQIIGVAPGVYTGGSNVVTLNTSKPKFLIIGLQGAGKTFIDGTGGGNFPWEIDNAAVISSLTFRNWARAISISAASQEVRLVDLVVRDNGNPSYTSGVDVGAASKTYIVGSTFFNNTGRAQAQQIWIGSGAATITNTLVWSSLVWPQTATTTGPMLAKAGGATLTTNNCLVKDQTLTGTGNLAGTVDAKIHLDGHLRSDSPLRAAGASVAQSRIDVDGELRPSSSPDIGADQFTDGDADGLPDVYEVATYGNTTTVAGGADDDSDGLNNVGEYDWETDRLNADTDGDGVPDGLEVAYGMNPLVADSGDDLDTELNGDGLLDAIGLQLGYSVYETDDDGDSVSNVDEVAMCMNPFSADTDGDGIPDSSDAFPHDPLMSSLVSNPLDVTPPQITLTAHWYAIEQ